MNTSSTTDSQPTVTWVLEAKFKDLTDEEIIDEMKCIDWAELSVWDTEILKVFARAILRKAQEK